MAYTTISATDYKVWDDAGLDSIMEEHEMTYVNQEEDGFDCLRGEWFMADDDLFIIIFGTFGNDHSPGASHYTYAELYDDKSEYQKALAEWEAKPEYIDTPDDEEDEDSDEDEEEPEEDDLFTYDKRTFYCNGKLAFVVYDDDTLSEAYKRWAKKEQYWPNIWLVEERGDHTRLC